MYLCIMRTYKTIANKARKIGRAPTPAIAYFPKDEVLDSLKKSGNKTGVCFDLGLSTTRDSGNTRALRHLDRIAGFHDIDIKQYIVLGTRPEKIMRYTEEQLAREVFIEQSIASRVTVKRYLFDLRLKEELCEECNIGTLYNDKKLVLELHHINGVGNDNRLENLQILCPNCHSQTDTYKGANVKR